MKRAKKILSVVLGVLLAFMVCVPAFAADVSPEEETQTEIIPDEEETVIIPDEEETVPEEENGIEDAITEEEDTYFECLEHCLNEGARNLGLGALFMGGSVCSPVLFMIFPPVGAVLFLAGLPFGAVCLFVGIGEIITSPVLALFFDTDDYLALV